jgi:hypothetical protein
LAVIWEATDRLGRLVVLTDAGWAHILERHGELAARGDEIREAIERAEEIRQDPGYSHRHLHFRRGDPASRRMCVVVHYRPHEPSGWVGEVITAFRTARRRNEEVLLWP